VASINYASSAVLILLQKLCKNTQKEKTIEATNRCIKKVLKIAGK